MARSTADESPLYKAKVVQKVCGISARQLGYWIERGLVRPQRCYRLKRDPRRDTFLFTLTDMVRIRLIKSFRDQGVSLQQIRNALEQLNKEGDDWESHWLVAFNGEIHHVRRDEQVESLSKKGSKQLVFPIIALGDARRNLANELDAGPYEPFKTPHETRGHVQNL